MALMNVIYTAVVIESERGWGQRVDEVKEFDTEEERDKFIEDFNAQNTEASAPDWYMVADRGSNILRKFHGEKK